MKQTTLVTRLALMLVMVGALALAGCGGDDNGGMEETMTPPVTPAPSEPAPSELGGVQQKAADAAAAAKTASDNAAAAVKTAMDATANIATMQTGGMSRMMAYEAKKAADGAMKAYTDAQMASEAAADATTTEAATTAKDTAGKAQMDAEKYATMAGEKSDGAVKNAAMELMVDGKDKSVGESMLHAGAGMLTTTDDDGNKTITGRDMSMDPMNMVAEVPGMAGMQDNPNTDPDEAETPMANVAAMKVAIGRTLDTSDDMARLMLVTHYAGSKMVKVFDYATAVEGDLEGTKAKITNDGTTAYEANEGALTSKGMYYLATGTTPNDLVAMDPTGTAPNLVNASDTVEGTGADMMGVPKPVAVYSYTNIGDDGALGGTDDTTHYVIENSSTTTGGTTTYNYRQVEVMVQLVVVGATDGSEIQLPTKDVNVMAKLPDAKAYEHLHFGVWANLGEAKTSGSQELDDLGIGFVQNISGMGRTETMPNHGMASYNGDWTAAVQGASEGAITLQNGAAKLTADLDKSTLKADLMGLAVLTADLTGNTFKGMKAAVMTGDPHGLNSSGTFTGELSGGFYGDSAVEAGGIFDFTSADIADGAFRGAFGGRLMDDN